MTKNTREGVLSYIIFMYMGTHPRVKGTDGTSTLAQSATSHPDTCRDYA